MSFCQILRSSLAISVSKKLNIYLKKQMGSVYNDFISCLNNLMAGYIAQVKILRIHLANLQSILVQQNHINHPMPFWLWLVGRTGFAMIKGTSSSPSCSDCTYVKVALNKALEPWLAPNGFGSTLHANKSPLEIPVFTGHLKVQTSAIWVQSNRTESGWWILKKKRKSKRLCLF